ncbi:MAG: glycosyltransferase family 10 domain-containing protein [Bacteroidia bacterium]
MKLNIFDSNGIKYSGVRSDIKLYKHIDIAYDQYDFDGITLFTDQYIYSDIVDKVKSKIKIAWLLEPKVINPNIYNISNIQNKFDYIFTHDSNLLNLNNKYKFVPVGGCWIPGENIKIHNKTKLISHILSNKFLTENHNLRKKIYEQYNKNIDCFGGYCNPVETIDLALNEYKFSICIENCSVENYFTEKIINCFATGTVPIYCGCINIGHYFNEKGILKIKNKQDFDFLYKNINDKLYYSMLEYVKENFEKSKNYFIAEDWIYLNILKYLNN